MKRIIVGISGASGSILGVRLLQALKGKAETLLIITETAQKILEHETGLSVRQVENLASKSYNNSDFFAPVASGSFKTDGMVIIPCSMKTLAGIASGFSDNLLLRTADVCLKERRKLILVARETPLSYIHIKNMETASKAGAILLPPVLSLYSKPKTIDDMVNHIVGKALDVLGFENSLYKRWK
ncbi:MAG TPA: UbiX family flavin prenyltransferase [archaeon]|jgi:polyprenyl P-hydroxybenzoate/phenylacrylic acid decarboxylase-like protein|nr:UbiX family flavin prenyltransferase [archaeon]